jgi:hypothetical protein
MPKYLLWLTRLVMLFHLKNWGVCPLPFRTQIPTQVQTRIEKNLISKIKISVWSIACFWHCWESTLVSMQILDPVFQINEDTDSNQGVHDKILLVEKIS